MSAIEASTERSSRGALWERVRETTPALLFGLRLWASVCLAFYVAFALQLSEPSWAGTTAALICQPALGASLRKATFRMIGTVVGAAGAVILAALVRQDAFGFLFGLSLGCAASVFVATLLRNFAAYGAALAGFTVAILASDILGATGASNGDVIMLAIYRATEICTGIVSAGVVLALTDLGNARRKLGEELARLSAAVCNGLIACLRTDGPGQPASRALRRDLLGGVIALDPMIDAAVGEGSDLRRHSPMLQQAVIGLIEAIYSWRAAALQVERMPLEAGRREAAAVRAELPLDTFPVASAEWMNEPAELRRACCLAARLLIRYEARTPSLRLLADSAAFGMLGIAQALNGLTQTVDPDNALSVLKTSCFTVPDWLPAFINAARAFAIVAILSLFWVETEWTSGALAITFGAVAAVLFPLQGDKAFATAMAFLLGCILAAVIATMLVFWALPPVTGNFAGLCLLLGLVLVPAGFFIALPWQPQLFFAASVNLIPMMSITNAMTYDASQFWNSTLAILAGLVWATVCLRLTPPLSPSYRAQRLLRLSLADLRRLARRRESGGPEAWRNRARARLLAIPDEAGPLERAQGVSALAIGRAIVRLRDVAPRFVPGGLVEATLEAIAQGDSTAAFARLDAIERSLAALPDNVPGARIVLRLRASVLAIGNELREFESFYNSALAP